MWLEGIDMEEIPEVGSVWRHNRTTMVYVVIAIANEQATRNEYPVTIVYRDTKEQVWSRPVSKWYKSMSFIGNRRD